MFNRLIFDNEMIDFLEKTSRNNKVSMLLIHGHGELISEEGNFIKRSDSDSLSYLPKSKFKKVLVDPKNPDYGIIDSEMPWSNEIGRVDIKAGRFTRKFLSKKSIVEYNITDKDIEVFVNLFKSYFQRNPDNLKIVEGKEILKWYLDENYQLIDGCSYGTLWNSCMRYRDRNKYMNLYTKNSNIKMLILLTDDGKLSARALLWEGVTDMEGKSYKVMDRIYSVHGHDVNFLKDWAKENGYIYKTDQSAKSERYFTDNDVKVKLDLSVKLENWKMDYYPYLDTFKFFDEHKGTLSNSEKYSYHYVLVQATGGLEPEPNDGDDNTEEFYDEAYDDNY